MFKDSMTTARPALVFALVLAASVAGCEKKAPATSAAQQARTVSVITVAPHEIIGGVSASGNLVPREDTAIFPQVAGFRVAQVLVDEGSWVKAGQPLAKLDDTLLRAQLAQQQALLSEQKVAASRAEAEAGRVKGLDTSGVLSLEQIQTRRFAAQTAQAQVVAANAALQDVSTRESLMTVRAPYAGLIIERNVRAGDLGATTTPWFRMAKDGQVELAADVSEDSLDKLKVGDPARVTLADGSEAPGIVRLVSPGVNAQTKLGRVRIQLPIRPDIRAGGFARAVFTGSTRSHLAVPETAVRYDADGASVMVVGPDNKLSRVAVTTGVRGGGWVELLTGPAPGARVVSKASSMFVPGDTVQPVDAS